MRATACRTKLHQLRNVSIHAPARGRSQNIANVAFPNLFQSTHLVRGATLWDREIEHCGIVSIHAPCGGDEVLRCRRLHDCVSSHAPARGATSRQPTLERDASSFNPRPRAGGRLDAYLSMLMYPAFQSTPPRGGRRRASQASGALGLRMPYLRKGRSVRSTLGRIFHGQQQFGVGAATCAFRGGAGENAIASGPRVPLPITPPKE